MQNKQDKMPVEEIAKLTDAELNAAIDSLISIDHPLSAEPYFAEASKRAKATKDTEWMLRIVTQKERLNSRRQTRVTTSENFLIEEIQEAWTPLKQLLYLERFHTTKDSADIEGALSDADELRKIQVSDLKSLAPKYGGINMLDFITVSLYNIDKNRYLTKGYEFYASYIETAAEKANDTNGSSHFLAQAIRLSAWKANDMETVMPMVEKMRKLAQGHNEPFVTSTMNYVEARVLLAKACDLDPKENRDQANVLIDSALALLRKVDIQDAHPTKHVASPYDFYTDKTIEPVAKNIINDIERKEVALSTKGNILPNAPLPVMISYRNMSEISLNIYKIDRNLPAESPIEKNLKQLPLRASRHILLNPDKMRLLPSSLYVELEKQEPGQYLIVAMDGETVACVQQTTVTNIGATNVGCDLDTDKLLIVDAKSGKVAPNVKVHETTRKMWDNVQFDPKQHLKADNDGWFACKTKKNYEPNYYVLEQGTDVVRFSKYSYRANRESNTFEPTSQVITDRAIYRPGQTVHAKIYLYKRNFNQTVAMGNTSFHIELMGGHGKKIITKSLETNEFGTASCEIDIPDDITKGYAYLQIVFANRTEFHSFRVEDFKRSDNKVTFDEITEVLLPGDEVTISGKCMAASGLPVVGAKVKYAVRTNSYSCTHATRTLHGGVKYAVRTNSYSWDDSIDSNDELPNSDGATTTDDEGRFSFTFKSCDNKKDELSYNASVLVTDNRGETTEATKRVIISPTGSEMNVRCPQTIVEGTTPSFSISSMTCNAANFNSHVHVAIYGTVAQQSHKPLLELDVDGIFPNEAHYISPKQDNEIEIDRTNCIFEADYAVSGEKDIKLENLKLAPQRYKIVATSKHANGDDNESIADLLVLSDQGDTPQLDRLTMDIENGRNQQGDTITLRVGSRLSDVHIWLLGSRNGSIIMRKELECSASVAKVQYVVPQDIAENENIEWSAFLWKEGDFFSKTSVSNLHPKHEDITLTLTSSKDVSCPGAKEKWTLNLGKDLSSEVVASMYDIRLDEYVNGQWGTRFSQKKRNNNLTVWQCNFSPNYDHGFDNSDNPSRISYNWWLNIPLTEMSYPTQIEPFEKPQLRNLRINAKGVQCARYSCDRAEAEALFSFASGNNDNDNNDNNNDYYDNNDNYDDNIRSDFRETVFFLPHLTPDSTGNIVLDFELPDNLTAYRFQALAHDKNMRMTKTEHTIEVRKAINMRMGTPRFVTENDQITLSADVTIADSSIRSGVASLRLFDADTNNPIGEKMSVDLSFEKSNNQRVTWEIVVPQHISSIKIEAAASATNDNNMTFNDVVVSTIPVEPANIEVPESQTFFLFEKGEHTVENPYTQGDSRDVVFSYTSNTFIEVMRALPCLDNRDLPSADTYLGLLETASIALMLQRNADIMKAVHYLDKNANDPAPAIYDAEHTPWLYMAQRLKQHDRNVVKLMTGSYASQTQKTALRRLAQMQKADGTIPWFDGMNGSTWLTVNIMTTIGEMLKLGILKGDEEHIARLVQKALLCIDKELSDMVALMKKHKSTLSPYSLEALYAHVLLNPKSNDDVAYLTDQLRKHWQFENMTDRVTAVAIFTLMGDKETANLILKSIEENLVQMDENRAYVAERGPWRRGAEMMGQSMLIIALERLNAKSPNLPKLINHLICQKRGEMWGNTQITSRAVLALLAASASDNLASTDIVSIANESATASTESPQVSIALDGKPNTAKAIVTKNNKIPTWGCWQRILSTPITQMPADPSEAIKISRTIRIRRGQGNDAQWETLTEGSHVNVGDRLQVTLSFYNDDPLSFVRIRDHRASTLEPTDKLSGYRGWWFWAWTSADVPTPPHYLSIGDNTMEFYVNHLNDGWHQLTYEVDVTNAGLFSAGYAEIQCLYEPDIRSHSEGSTLKVE